MKTKAKIALIIILVAVLAAAVVLYIISKKQKECESCNSLEGVQIEEDINPSVSASPARSASPSSSPTSGSSLVYENNVYKFKITLSEVWKNYSVEKAVTPSDGSAEVQLDFVLPSGSGRAVPLSILVYPASKVSGGLAGSIEIKRNAQYVFGYKIWSAAPSDLQQVTEKEIADRLKTFELTK